MSGRYSGWRKLKGDTADRPDLLDLGKKLLGFLDNQRTLSGVSTISITRELPDGSVVMARWTGNLPEIYVKEGPPRGPYTILDGFFARPTPQSYELFRGSHYGTYWSEAGYQIPLAAIRKQDTPATSLNGYWHSTHTAIPMDAPARYYDRWFGDAGLQATANVDWTGDGGVLHFFGPLNRYNDPSTYYREYVYHNGKVLLDVDDIAGGLKVVGCAIAGGVLRVMCRTANTLYAYAIRLQAVAPMPGVPVYLHPRLTCEGYDGDGLVATLLGSTSMDPDDAGYWHPFHFNQRGDECRSIGWKYDSGQDLNVPYEVVASWTDGACGFSSSDAPFFAADEDETLDETGSVSLATGGLRNSEDGGATFLTFPARSTINGGAVPTVPSESDYTREVTVGGWTRVFVDYRDNVPVYMEAKPEHGTHAITQTFARTVNSSQSTGYLTWDTMITAWSCATGGQDADLTTATTWLESMDYRTSFRADWFELEDVRQRDVDTTIDYHIDVDSGTGGQCNADIERTTATERTAVDTEHALIHVDLRHKVLCYQKTTITETYSMTAVEDSFYDPTWPTGGTTTNSTTQTETDTRIVLKVAGVDVETDILFSNTDTTAVVDAFTAASFSLTTSAFTLLLLTPTTPGAGGTVDELEPPQLTFLENVRHTDFAPITPHAPYGAWAVSGSTLAYSYTIQQGLGVLPADQEPQRHGFCTLAGVKYLDVTWPSLATDPGGTFRRYSPICALSPFATK